MRLRSIVVLVVVVAGVALAGCASDAGLSSTARIRLGPLVEQVRHEAESEDVAGARRALTAVQNAVASEVKQGDISAAKAAQILTAVAGVSSHLDLVSSTTTTTTTSTPTTTTPTTRPRPGKHEGGKGKGGND